MAIVGCGLLAMIGEQIGYVGLMGRLLLISPGVGLCVPPMTAALLSRVPRQRSGMASSVLDTVRQAAGAIGVAAFGTLAAGSTSTACDSRY